MGAEIKQGMLFAADDSGRRPAYRQGMTKHDDYDGFVEKFKPKKTTDDCYTPSAVYDAVLEWVAEVVEISGREIVRPFWPGGDYENFDYPDGCIVIDNPPFSIITKIIRFYMAQGIRFFLFAPHLTMFSPKNIEWTCIVCDCTIEYENKAKVNTGFVSNMFGACRIMTAPTLCHRIKEAQRNAGSLLSRHKYPDNVVSSALLGKIARHVEFRVMADECIQIGKLDAQQDNGIYGGGFLLSEKKTAEKMAAEKIAAENRVAGINSIEDCNVWELSDREKKTCKVIGII